MFLTIGGMILLGILSLTYYRSINTSNENLVNNNSVLIATSIGETIMSEIENEAFDEMTIDSTVTDPNALTLASSFGPESGEVYPFFDDVDDFHLYTKSDTISKTGIFRTSVKVKYVEPMNADNTSGNRTFSKAVSLFITSPLIRDTVKFYRVFAY